MYEKEKPLPGLFQLSGNIDIVAEECPQGSS
jgi:hypothetical protein